MSPRFMLTADAFRDPVKSPLSGEGMALTVVEDPAERCRLLTSENARRRLSRVKPGSMPLLGVGRCRNVADHAVLRRYRGNCIEIDKVVRQNERKPTLLVEAPGDVGRASGPQALRHLCPHFGAQLGVVQ